MLDLISLVSFFVLGFIGWITYKIYIWPIYLTPLRNIPGPPSESLLYGNYKTLMKEKVNVVYINLNFGFHSTHALSFICFFYIYVGATT